MRDPNESRSAGTRLAPAPGRCAPELPLESLRADLVRAARAACPSWMACEAEDLAHEVAIRMLERCRRGEAVVVHEPSYWRRAAYHAVVDEIRRRRRRREEPLNTLAENAGVAARIDPSPEREASGREVGRAIAHCLSLIGEGRRLATVLHLQGHTLREAAALLGWHEKRTESFLYRGLNDLRLCLLRKGLRP